MQTMNFLYFLSNPFIYLNSFFRLLIVLKSFYSITIIHQTNSLLCFIISYSSTESGWDNPFRPGGDLSREADEIVNWIKDGKPITPTGDPAHSTLIGNGATVTDSPATANGGATVVDGATKVEVNLRTINSPQADYTLQ